MSIYISNEVAETKNLAYKLGERLFSGTHILLFGDLGSGKTHFVQGLSHSFNITEKIKSPTYTLLNKHQGRNLMLYHYDLYRLQGDEMIDFMSLLEDFEDNSGIVVIEWADRLPKRYYPEQRIEVYFKVIDENTRQITIQFYDTNTPTLDEIKQLRLEFMCPRNICKHMDKVAELVVNYGQKLISKGEIVDVDLARKAALLHDLVRIVSVEEKELNHKLVQDDITAKKLKLWSQIRHKYSNMGHEEMAAVILKEQGFFELAEIVRKHRFDFIKNSQIFKHWEEKLLYYADKRVLHDQVVSLKERFDDSLQRHYGGLNSASREELIRLNYELEKEILK